MRLTQLLLGLCFVLSSLSVLAKPEPIQPLSRAIYSLEFYQTQASLWATETQREPGNANAWLNYYTAARNVNVLQGYAAFDLSAIAAQLRNHLPDSFETHYITYWQSSLFDKNYQALLKAHAVAPERQEIAHDLVHYYVVTGDAAAFSQWCDQLHRSDYFSPGILQWNYNALASVRADGVLLTQGDNDTYPAWVLQEIKQVRTDIKVVNLYLLLAEDEYRRRTFAELGIPNTYQRLADASINVQLESLLRHVLQHCARPVHLGISTPTSQREAFNSQLYLTGLAFEHSQQYIDNVRLIRHRFENEFLTEQLSNPLYFDPGQTVVDHMNMNYVPALALLRDLYQNEGAIDKAEGVAALALEIAAKAGKEEDVETLFRPETPLNTPLNTNIDLRAIDKQLQAVNERLFVSSFELSNGVYQHFLEDLLHAKRFDLLEICQTHPTDWVALLPAIYQRLSTEVLFERGHPEAENMPVVNITYEAAVIFCDWLTDVYNASNHRKKRFQKVQFRLPSIAEWENVARGGKPEEVPYPWGGPYNQNAKGCYLSNFNPYLVSLSETEAIFGPDENPESPGEDGGYFTVPVDAYFPNCMKVYNLSGNVAEMVQEAGVTKGGGWLDPSYYTQIGTTKQEALPSPNVGFRIFAEVLK